MRVQFEKAADIATPSYWASAFPPLYLSTFATKAIRSEKLLFNGLLVL
jgi:hypothetical protein